MKPQSPEAWAHLMEFLRWCHEDIKCKSNYWRDENGRIHMHVRVKKGPGYNELDCMSDSMDIIPAVDDCKKKMITILNKPEKKRGLGALL